MILAGAEKERYTSSTPSDAKPRMEIKKPVSVAAFDPIEEEELNSSTMMLEISQLLPLELTLAGASCCNEDEVGKTMALESQPTILLGQSNVASEVVPVDDAASSALSKATTS